MNDRCAIPGCPLETGVLYLDHNLCQVHWDQLTAEDQPADALARALGIQAAEATTTEKIMATKKKDEEKETIANSKPAEVPAAEPAAEPKPKKQRVVKTEAVAAEVAAAPVPQVQKERKPRKELPPRVFAFRLDDAELKAIHDTAGPRNASRFIRAVAAAFAAEDEKAFSAVLVQAKQARA